MQLEALPVPAKCLAENPICVGLWEQKLPVNNRGVESLGNSRTSHSDTRVVKPEYLTRLFNRLLCLMAVECGLVTKHDSSAGKYPSGPNYTIINGCIALQPNAMKLERMPAGPGLEESGSWRRLPAWQRPLQSCQATSLVWSLVQRCQAHFTVMETKAHQSSVHSCSSNHRGGPKGRKVA